MTQDYEHEEYLEGEEIEIEAIGIDVDAHPIELYKLFKIANLVSGGGEAKHIIEEGYVAVNGELETRKRRKMYDGDFFAVIRLLGIAYWWTWTWTSMALASTFPSWKPLRQRSVQGRSLSSLTGSRMTATSSRT